MTIRIFKKQNKRICKCIRPIYLDVGIIIAVEYYNA